MKKKKKPQTEKEWSAYRAGANCRIGQKMLTGKSDPPDGVTRTDYALYCLLCAVEELAELMEAKP